MTALAVGLICTGLMAAFMLILNEMGINVNIRKEKEFDVLLVGKVAPSGRVVQNGGNAIYLGNMTMPPGQRVVVAVAK